LWVKRPIYQADRLARYDVNALNGSDLPRSESRLPVAAHPSSELEQARNVATQFATELGSTIGEANERGATFTPELVDAP